MPDRKPQWGLLEEILAMETGVLGEKAGALGLVCRGQWGNRNC